MKTSTLIKKAWMSGWNSANSEFTERTRDSYWVSSGVYKEYLKLVQSGE